MQTMYVMVGNIGTGKTTRAKRLVDDDTLYVSEDLLVPLMTNGRYDPPVWSIRHFNVYRKLKLAAVEAALLNGFNLIVDGTNISVENRVKYIDAAKRMNALIICYVFPDFDIGLQNRFKEHRGQTAEMWKSVSNSLQDKFDYPKKEEGINEIIVVNTPSL